MSSTVSLLSLDADDCEDAESKLLLRPVGVLMRSGGVLVRGAEGRDGLSKLSGVVAWDDELGVLGTEGDGFGPGEEAVVVVEVDDVPFL